MAEVLCPVVVGREQELVRIDSRLAALGDGRGGCVAVTGEPGIGKSRLTRELVVRASALGAAVLAGRAIPAGASAPYRPFTEALLQGLRGRPLPSDAAFRPWRAVLATVVPGLDTPELPSDEVSTAARGEAVVRLLRHLADDAPLVVLLEDLHWADPDTVEVLEYVADNTAREPILCVVTARTEPASPALALIRRQRGRVGFTHLTLHRLGDDATAAMVRACVPSADPALVARVQHAAEGVPLLVEDLLASPGVPRSFAETVRERLDELDDAARRILEAAAVLGHHFDWQLLAPMTGESSDAIERALACGVRQLLLALDGSDFRFRHALTREAVVESMLPTRHRALAAAGLAAVDAAHRSLDGPVGELAADLAARAGDRRLAGALLAAAGRASFDRGALATAIDTLRHAADLLDGDETQVEVEVVLVEAYGFSGRVDEAAAVGVRLINRLVRDPSTLATRVDVHLRLANAAIAACRWDMARHHIDRATHLGAAAPSSVVRARLAVLEAEVAFARDDTTNARRLAGEALDSGDVAPEIRCHAFEIIGRSDRFDDLAAARVAFEHALTTAEAAELPVWRLRALHELGTIDMFDHAGSSRLLEARATAERLGAVGTGAVLDLQLAATFTCRWDLDTCDEHARNALNVADRLGLAQVRAKALAMLAGSESMRGHRDETDDLVARSIAAAPDDRMLDGFGWGARGFVDVVEGDIEHALAPFTKGMAILSALPHAEPAALRALWPLLLASTGDRRAAAAVDEAHRLGVSRFRLNRALIAYAEGVLAGRAGQPRRADEVTLEADPGFANCETWLHLARACAACAARADGWGEPARWLGLAAKEFERRALPGLAERCRAWLSEASPNPWAERGITAREADVLRLVASGLANKEIAQRLGVSPRTVEKHVESLLRKTDARSRTALALVAAETDRRRGT